MKHLQRALVLAERGRGTASPNPLVGAVVVRDGEVVGEGWHERPGEPHAEVNALRAAGDRAAGATLYVTLEPCAHHGRTPPCADAVIAAGVTRVVVGTRDVNPVALGGVDRLRAAGVEVDVVGSREARAQNAGYFSVLERGRPWVILKLASTLDGRANVPDGRWITGEAARRRVHELRAWVDAVAVGMGTVRADAPRLDARGVAAERQPRRLAFGHGPLPAESELELRSGPSGEELRALAGEGVQTLVLEGGPTLARSFFEADQVDELHVYVARRLDGSGPSWLDALPSELPLRDVLASSVGDDLLLTAHVHEP
jgi:diaminohydroxyphosphoribosylaminopyrimidine deaminase / 5-amino-6-(5-phosphoribosylamino)uracil reductase